MFFFSSAEVAVVAMRAGGQGGRPRRAAREGGRDSFP